MRFPVSDSLLRGRLVRNFGKGMSLFETKDLFYLLQVYLKNTKKKLLKNYLRLGGFSASVHAVLRAFAVQEFRCFLLKYRSRLEEPNVI